MPSSTSILLEGMGPQVGAGMPFGGPYSNVYGTTPGAQTAEDQYWSTINRGYDNQQQQLMRDAFGKGGLGSEENMYSNATVYDPATGRYTFDINKVDPGLRKGYGDQAILQGWEQMKNDSNEDRAQARQQLELLAQQRAGAAARTQQQAAERAGFLQELQRYNAPNLMAQMINPAVQQAGNQAMATANAAGMAGGSMGQAANRRAAMMGFGQQAANVVPQAAVQQNDINFNWQKAREGMINNYYGLQNQRAQQDMANQMAQTTFRRGMEQYEHSRSREDLEAVGSAVGNVGALASNFAPFAMGRGGGQQGGG